jgi:hypothetical protein
MQLPRRTRALLSLLPVAVAVCLHANGVIRGSVLVPFAQAQADPCDASEEGGGNGGAGGGQPGQPAENLYRPAKDIFLLQPILDDEPCVQNDGTINVFFIYFSYIWPWLIGSAAGIAVLWGIIAGVMIMLSGENTELRTKGRDHLMTVIKGLLMIALAGFLLRQLNSLFYK